MIQQAIGVDLGGTAIKLGRFGIEGQLFATLEIPTPQPSTPDSVVGAIVAAIAEIDPDRLATVIGVGMPGPADRAGRVARIAINLAGWQDVPLADALEAKTGRSVTIDNDANCAGLGELWLGAGQGFANGILVTLGTGVGGAIWLEGQIWRGRDGAAGELGLITLRPEGPRCNSGNAGSLEQFCSIQAIRRRSGFSPGELGDRALQGDAAALAFWQDYGRDLGAGIASLIYVLTPEVVLIGGGISASAPFFLPTVQAEIEQRVMATSRSNLKILVAQLGNRAGQVGAAKLAIDRLRLIDLTS
jgi:glucokinase